MLSGFERYPRWVPLTSSLRAGFRASHFSSHNGGSTSKVFPELAQASLLAQQATLKAQKRTKSKLNPLLASRWGPKTQATLVDVTVLLLLCLRHPCSLSNTNPTTIFSRNKPLSL